MGSQELEMVETPPATHLAGDHCLDQAQRLRGALLGTALGDALGLPAERLPAHQVSRRFGAMDRFHLLGTMGFVSDDTEQAALIAQSLARHPEDAEACASDFRRALLGWFLRLPWGVGMATIKACLRIAVGLQPSGVRSAGNGAAMRAAMIGVFFTDNPAARQRFGLHLAEVTHLDDRAVEGALFVAELSAALCHTADRNAAFAEAAASVIEPELGARLARAAALAQSGAPVAAAAAELGTTGFVLHTVPFAAFCFLRFGDEPLPALQQAISAGGDTDSIAAILGSWLGTLHGEAGLPAPLLRQLHDGPFGPSHLRALADCLAAQCRGDAVPVPSYSPLAALTRNLLLYPVILYHGFRRLLP